ncbi:MAG: hypothetical protein R6V00_00915 [Candidatus Aminicenantes bacterium]
MNKNNKSIGVLLFVLGTFFILNLVFFAGILKAQSLEEKEELKATVNIKVSWKNHDEYNGNLEETGFMSASVTGTLVKQKKGLLAFFPGGDGMRAQMQYQNVKTDKKTGEFYSREEGSGSLPVLSPQSISDPQTQGHLEFLAFTGPGARAHALQLAGQIDPSSLMEVMKSQENMDHYVFSVVTPIRTIVTSKEGDTVSGLRGIHFSLIAEALSQGVLTNSLSWTSQKIEHHLGYQSFMGSLYDPPKSGDVSYTVSWTFGEVPPELRIFIKEKEMWNDITGEDEKEFLIGQRVQLKCAVIPESLGTPQQIQWDIPGMPDLVIKGWKGNENAGTKESFTENDCQKETIIFAWVDGSFSGQPNKIVCKAQVKGEPLEADTTIKVYKPMADVIVTAGKAVTFPAQGSCEMLPDSPSIKLDSTVTLPDQYADKKFTVFYVQKVKTNAWGLERRNAAGPTYEWVSDTCDWLLDTSFPYNGYQEGVGTVKFTMQDTPGWALTSLASAYVSDEFQNYLMFIPPASEGGDSVPVPLKQVDWKWKGACVAVGDIFPYPIPPCGQGHKIIVNQPPSQFRPHPMDCSQHPEWTGVKKEKPPHPTRNFTGNRTDPPPKQANWKK